jgi:hypothetical protein
MSNAATGNEQVQALVFIAGWMPDEGESIQQLLEAEAFGDSLVPAALRPVPFKNPDGSEGVDLYLDLEVFPETFAADVDPETAAVMAATQRPWSGAAAATPSGPPGWRAIPSWYLLSAEDRATTPAGQQARVCRGWSARGPVHRPGCFPGASVAPKRDCGCQKQSVRLYSTSQKESRGGVQQSSKRMNERNKRDRYGEAVRDVIRVRSLRP